MRAAFIVAAVAIAAGVTWYVDSLLQSNQTTTVEKELVQEPAIKVMVASQTLYPGTLITDGSLSFQKWPQSTVRAEYYTEEEGNKLEELTGHVVRSEIVAGEPVLPEKIIEPGEQGFLAAVLKPGTRAVSIPVNPTTGVSGFVSPGDFVDVLLSQTTQIDGESRYVSQTIIKNARVIASGQSLKPTQGKAIQANTVTLELTPKIAELAVLANQIGTLTVSLTPVVLSDAEIAETRSTEFGRELIGIHEMPEQSISYDFEASPVLDPFVIDTQSAGLPGGLGAPSGMPGFDQGIPQGFDPQGMMGFTPPPSSQPQEPAAPTSQPVYIFRAGQGQMGDLPGMGAMPPAGFGGAPQPLIMGN